ncbi:MAG: hypothetical protein SGILL_002822, partial [Bacillariaceae sp.]
LYFQTQPHRLLEIDLTDPVQVGDGKGWALLCQFMGISSQACPDRGGVPHSNKTPEKCLVNATSNGKWERISKKHEHEIPSGPKFAKHVQNIRLPLISQLPSHKEEDRYDKYLLPPRLQLHNDSSALRDNINSGVLMSCTGDIGYAKKQLLPFVDHLKNDLKIPDARQRSLLRNDSFNNSTNPAATIGFALVTSRAMKQGVLRPVLDFFDAVWTVEELADYPPGSKWQNSSALNPQAVKIVKVHTMASAPWDYTVMMDIDTIPQSADFVQPLLKLLDGADIAMTNKWPAWMDKFPADDYHHWLVSALPFCNATRFIYYHPC